MKNEKIDQSQNSSARLKLLRKETHAKQVDMAQFLNCSPNHYQKIEYGQINIPATSLMALADYFGVTTDYLLGRSDERRPL